jgi:hypothetical protein
MFSYNFLKYTSKMYGFLRRHQYGLWSITEVWVIDRNLLQTKLVTRKIYGLLEIMGYEGYGLRGLRLYTHFTFVSYFCIISAQCIDGRICTSFPLTNGFINGGRNVLPSRNLLWPGAAPKKNWCIVLCIARIVVVGCPFYSFTSYRFGDGLAISSKCDVRL